MGLTAEEIVTWQNHAREFRIAFVGELSQDDWPQCHKETLRAVKELGEKKFESYATDASLVKYETWKIRLKSLATVLVDMARRSIQSTENDWRHKCEHIIMGRLSSEVCCRTCRKRLWRSEIEVAQEGNDGSAMALRRRQRMRQPCRCSREDRPQDHFEAAGLNKIFTFRVDDTVHQSPELTKKLGKKQQPDRVCGLRLTRNIENLLNDDVRQELPGGSFRPGTKVLQLIKQPLHPRGDALLFPFLVLEAKSDSAADSWHSIQLQTAFPIRTFLNTQLRLRTLAGRQSKWKSGPLVWFLANKGEDWRLSATYIQDGPERPNTVGKVDYRIIDMWRGSILTRDGALQLLLLIDYIFDWARDIYREAILRELRVIATGDNDTASLVHTDSDIASIKNIDPFQVVGEGGDATLGHGEYTVAQSLFMALDSSKGAVRHATFVESKYCCIYVTEDNVQTMLLSTEPTKIERLCRVVLAQMANAVLLDQPGLDAIEEEWTGTHRLPTMRHHLSTQFYTAITCTSYLSPYWHQVRELFIIAIAEGAWPAVVTASQLKPNRGKAKKPTCARKLEVPELIENITRLRCGTPGEVLLSSITRRAVRVGMDVDELCFIADAGSLRGVVGFVYDSFKRGTFEPQESFLRISNRLDQQHKLELTGSAQIFPFQEQLQASDDGCVLVNAKAWAGLRIRRLSPVCVYLVGSDPHPPVRETLAKVVKKAFETRDVYHTVRNYRSSNINNLTQQAGMARDIWNIGNSYGVHAESFNFLYLIQALGAGSPVTQGSGRPPAATNGAQMYRRNMAPWQDRTFIYMDLRERMFTLYKLFTREAAYWRAVAQERTANDVPCCPICASPGSLDTCPSCKGVLENARCYRWLKAAMLGQQPFPVRPLEDDAVTERIELIQKDKPGLSEYIAPWPMSGTGSDDADWVRNLDFYGLLNDPFEDLHELRSQRLKFQEYCNERDRSRYNFMNYPRKRKRTGDGEGEVDENKDDEEDGDEEGNEDADEDGEEGEDEEEEEVDEDERVEEEEEDHRSNL